MKINSSLLEKRLFGNSVSLYVKMLLLVMIALFLGRIIYVLANSFMVPGGLIEFGGLIYLILTVFFLVEKYTSYKKQEKESQNY